VSKGIKSSVVLQEPRLDQLWGRDQRRTTPGLQEAIGYLCARLTFEEAAHKHSSVHEQQELRTGKSIERLSIEMDGIMERLRRGTVEMEASEKKRKGDVYRELKVGAIFEAERGRERSELAKDGLGGYAKGEQYALCRSTDGQRGF
jgi:hypothetical protein